MSEKTQGNPCEGHDAELSAHAEANLGSQYLPEGHVQGEVIVGLPSVINPNFNAGVPQGPWLAPEGKVKHDVEAGWTEDESRAHFDATEKQRMIHVNTYPMQPIGEMKVVSDVLRKQASEIVNKKR